MSAVYRVDLEAFSRNLDRVRAAVAPAAHMLVVKDDAYAHGLAPLVRRAFDEGVRWFGAFDVATGAAVRSVVGPEARIFVWLIGGADDLSSAIASDLDLGIGDEALLDDLAALALDGVARIHLKIDTGLHRNGIRPERWNEALARTADLVAEGRGVLEGIWSHISEASDDDDDEARAVFLAGREAARAAGLDPRFSHLAASAAGFARGEFREDLVRVGAFSYGIRPAGGPGEGELGIEPIAALVTTVTSVDTQGVHLDLGSLHGLPSTLAGRFDVDTPAGPRRVETIEPASLVVAPWPEAAAGDEIVVFGRGARNTATDLAEIVDTIGEEIALRVSPIVPRSYVTS